VLVRFADSVTDSQLVEVDMAVVKAIAGDEDVADEDVADDDIDMVDVDVGVTFDTNRAIPSAATATRITAATVTIFIVIATRWRAIPLECQGQRC
jgi:hypothetical protein